MVKRASISADDKGGLYASLDMKERLLGELSGVVKRVPISADDKWFFHFCISFLVWSAGSSLPYMEATTNDDGV